MKVDNVLVSLLNDYFMMKPNESLKHAEFTSDLLEINPMNDKMYQENQFKLHINGTLDDQRFFREYHIFERHIVMDLSEKRVLDCC
ncbi:hypothetical protein BD560DRAFT_441726 [Blakeslea trispora]|nr:hypothetical protein BD560DRAFT_441726 [Blakeslea trispora]